MFKIYDKLSNLTWNLFGQYRVFIVPLIFFIIAVVLYNIDVTISPIQTGILGYVSIFIYGYTTIYTIIKIIIAIKNKIEDVKNNKNK